mmetsp:Transcript_7614/g.14403  ORF Transcript_7614/g.14403 Transcript_7614/m.14403 type:complete len:321 (+) Transcript_7614:150-1112(+)
MTSNPTKKRKCTVLPRSTVEYLKNWMMSPDHITHPYPTEKEKAEIMAATGIEMKQLTNWFVNNRKRFWKPRVEARVQQHLQAQKTVESLISNKAQPTVMQTNCNTHQPQLPLQFSFVHTARPTITDPIRKFNNGFPPTQSAFRIITNHQTFAPPCSRDDTDNFNSQVVSMGSMSYSSDTDNNSLANSCSDGNDEETFYNISSRNKMTPSKNRVQKNHDTFTPKKCHEEIQIVSPSHEVTSMQSTSKKRVRSTTDILASFQPRTLTFNMSQEASTEPSQKRQNVKDWEVACRNARHCYDHSLPTLEEAAMLFGFATTMNKD